MIGLFQASSILVARSLRSARFVVFVQLAEDSGLSIRGHGFDSRTRHRLRLLTDQDLRLRISGWRFESARSHESRP